MSKTYNRLLKFLYFEGYADSYEEAEYLLEEMSDDEFDEVEGLSRLPKGSLEEVTDRYLRDSARAAMEKEAQRRREEAEKRKQLSLRAREDFRTRGIRFRDRHGWGYIRDGVKHYEERN